MVETRLVGYARVSTDDQNLEMQIAALKRAGVMDVNLHVDKASGVSKRRPGFELAMKDCRWGDTLVVWKLDRLTRSPPQLYALLEELKAKNVRLLSLTEMLDTDTAIGQLVIGMAAVVAAFERNLISERTRAGIEAIRAKKAKGELDTSKWGRTPSLTEKQIVEVGKLLNRAKAPLSASAAAKHFGVSRPTIGRYWMRNPEPNGPRFVRKSNPRK